MDKMSLENKSKKLILLFFIKIAILILAGL